MHFCFRDRDTRGVQLYNNNTEYWDVIAEIPFDSDRKRMSVIMQLAEVLEDQDYGGDKLKEEMKVDDVVGGRNYMVFSKGADSVMIPLIKWRDEHEKRTCQQHVREFAKRGLRTLVMASRRIPQRQA